MQRTLFAYSKKGYFYPLLLILLGFLLFHSVLAKGFILDDKSQIITNTAVHSLTTIPYFFTKTLHYGDSVTLLTGFTYRPITYTVYAVLYILGFGTPFAFHLFLLLLYIINAILVFFLFRRLTKPFFAFLLALLFLIHPANQEIVTYIADIQDALYFFFGIGALLIVGSNLAQRKRLPVTFALLGLACLSKETGILFVFAVAIYVFLFTRDVFGRYIFACAALFVCYFLLRINAGHEAFLTIAIPSQSTITNTLWHSQLLLAPKILAYYCATIIMPLPALPLVYLAEVNILQSFLSFIFVLSMVILGIVLGKSIKRKSLHSFKAYVFFFSFLFLSMLFHSQLIPLDVLISKRWLYSSLFAFLGMICIIMDLHARSLKKHVRIISILGTLYFTILLTETLIATSYY